MSFSSDEILIFATQIAFALSQPWGKNWTPREIDGCFYNHYLNPKIQEALRNIRRRHLGQEGPPWPGRFDSQDLPGEVRLASLGHYPLRTVEMLDLEYMAEQFGVNVLFFQVSYLTGMPIPFCRYAIKIHTDYLAAPIFRLDIFSRRILDRDWSSIGRAYSRWLEVLASEEHKPRVDSAVARVERGLLHDLRKQFVKQGVPHLELLAYPPFASPNVFVLTAKEHFEKEKKHLTGRGTPEVAIRAWTSYLLTKLVGTTNREAIAQINEVIGQQCGTYAMNEILGGTGGHSGGATSSGEIQFSNDKTELMERISNYDTWLAQADPSWSFIN